MKKTKLSILLSLILSIIIVISGCQSIGGVDINKAFTSNMTTKSYEGQTTISVELMWDEELLASDEDLAVIKLFENIKLDFFDVKLQDMYTMSMKGVFHFSKGEIPFELAMTKEQIAIQIEGANQPIFIEMSDTEFPSEFIVIQDQIESKSYELLEAVGGFIIKSLPNPETISYSSGLEAINGENIFLHKIHAEVYADELLDLTKKTLENILQDTEGLKEVIGQVYDILVPIADEFILRAENVDPMFYAIVPFLEDRDFAIETIYTLIKDMLTPVAAEFDSYAADMLQEEEEFLNDQSYYKTDIYIDNSLKIRKQDFELVFQPKLEESDAFKGFRITGGSELWNIDDTVTADVIDTVNGYDAETITKPIYFLKMLKQDSVLYKLLKEDLQITHKEMHLVMSDNQSTGMSNKPFIKDKTTMVPARFVSEQLDAEVFWNGEKKEVTVIDILTEKEIVLTIDSNIAYVDGVPVELMTSPVLKDGSSYVPVRFIVDSLGGMVEWNDELRMVTITKE